MNDEVIQGTYTWEEFYQALAKIIDDAKVPSTEIEDNMKDWLDIVWKAGYSSEGFKSV